MDKFVLYGIIFSLVIIISYKNIFLCVDALLELDAFGARWMHVRTTPCYALHVKNIILCFVPDNNNYIFALRISKDS